MKKTFRRFLASLLIVCMVVTSLGTAGAAVFADLAGHWAEQAVERWQNEGVLLGDGNGSFRPDDPVTRAEMASGFARLLQLPEGSGQKDFADVPETAW
jgi:hypothetical protein